MGAPQSPALCMLVTVIEEYMWMQTYTIFVDSPQFCQWSSRYADNRFMLVDLAAEVPQAFEVFLSPTFYQEPILLETVTDNKVLGFHCDAINRQLTISLPTDPYCYRSPRSAGTDSLLISGLKTRLITIRRFTYPKSLIPIYAHRLARIYIQKGFDPNTIRRLTEKSFVFYVLICL